jgi:antitoxin component of MazEF toxin-antitoxin module
LKDVPTPDPPFVSRAVRATRGSSSLRVTIPQVVASTLGLQPGDAVEWTLDPLTGQVRVARSVLPKAEAAAPHA